MAQSLSKVLAVPEPSHDPAEVSNVLNHGSGPLLDVLDSQLCLLTLHKVSKPGSKATKESIWIWQLRGTFVMEDGYTLHCLPFYLSHIIQVVIQVPIEVGPDLV